MTIFLSDIDTYQIKLTLLEAFYRKVDLEIGNKFLLLVAYYYYS